jgi:hypothetical protein
MKWITILLLFLSLVSFNVNRQSSSSPLAAYSEIWNEPRFLKCNTAAKTTYLTEPEKELIYILNMMHMDPQLFDSTVVKYYPEKSGALYLRNIPENQSLLDTLSTLAPLPLLSPDRTAFESAECHAISAGQKGYVGHERQSKDCEKKKDFNGECCDYGRYTPLDILMGLLIDEGVPSLGHRWLCLCNFRKVGVSIQPHTTYGKNTVIDFKY